MHRAPILHSCGFLLLLFCMVYLVPLGLALGEAGENLQIFLYSLLITAAASLALILPYRNHREQISRHGAFVLVALFWCGPSLFGALPFWFYGLSFSDALFESLSGLTTTGATVLSGLDTMPRSLLFFRQSLQWVGGIGLVVIAVAILPLLGIGGLQLYRAETPGSIKNTQIQPRILASARLLFLIYCGLTALCAGAYWIAGMSVFDAICHSFSTISIGGFSTHDASFAFFSDRPVILLIAIFFMVTAGINFALHFYALKKFPHGLTHGYWRDPECRFYLLCLLIVAATCVLGLLIFQAYSPQESLLHGMFQAVSFATTTGFSSTDFSSWPTFLPYFLVGTAFVGACAGSTGGGIKAVRVLLILKQGLREIHYLVHPRSVLPLKLGSRATSERSVHSVWSFLSMYIMAFILLLMLMLSTSVDFRTSFYAVVATLNNLGPGLGEVAKNYSGLSDPAKWMLCGSMLLGRLEIVSLMVLFSPRFWRH